MSEPTLTPQEPGVLPGVDDSKLQALAAGSVENLLKEIDELDDDELEQLRVLEQQGKARTTALGAIMREQQKREIAREHPADGDDAAGVQRSQIGDTATYAAMSDKDIDPKSLTSPVLSRDGWVLPAPRPQE